MYPFVRCCRLSYLEGGSGREKKHVHIEELPDKVFEEGESKKNGGGRGEKTIYYIES